MKQSYRERELIFCMNRMEQYWIKLTERNLERKLSNKKTEKLLMILNLWEDITERMLLKLNPKINT